jgi:hypothetical protein
MLNSLFGCLSRRGSLRVRASRARRVASFARCVPSCSRPCLASSPVATGLGHGVTQRSSVWRMPSATARSPRRRKRVAPLMAAAFFHTLHGHSASVAPPGSPSRRSLRDAIETVLRFGRRRRQCSPCAVTTRSVIARNGGAGLRVGWYRAKTVCAICELRAVGPVATVRPIFELRTSSVPFGQHGCVNRMTLSRPHQATASASPRTRRDVFSAAFRASSRRAQWQRIRIVGPNFGSGRYAALDRVVGVTLLGMAAKAIRGPLFEPSWAAKTTSDVASDAASRSRARCDRSIM